MGVVRVKVLKIFIFYLKPRLCINLDSHKLSSKINKINSVTVYIEKSIQISFLHFSHNRILKYMYMCRLICIERLNVQTRQVGLYISITSII